MIKIALVGDIGSGKTFIASMFSYPTFNADNEVAKIYSADIECFKKLKKKLPKFFYKFPIGKKDLIKAILHNNQNLKKITKVVHPIIKKRLKVFLKHNKKKKLVILDIPLYLENKLDKKRYYNLYSVQKNRN